MEGEPKIWYFWVPGVDTTVSLYWSATAFSRLGLLEGSEVSEVKEIMEGIWMGFQAGKRRGTWCNYITISRKIIVLKIDMETPGPLSLSSLPVYLEVNSFTSSWVLRHDFMTPWQQTHCHTEGQPRWKPQVKIGLASLLGCLSNPFCHSSRSPTLRTFF